jgi:phosphoribosyl 1,2-cyclic phosphodiesterase
MKLLVHGCRGSIPISSPQSYIYGGNTSCYELIFNEYQLIFDTGTGFRHVSIDESKKTIIFYSHWHHDHIQVLAFNSGLFNPKKNTYITCALNDKNESKNIIHRYFSGFYFPIELTKKLSNLKFVEFNDLKKDFEKDFQIEFLKLNHPGGSVGYSIKNQYKKITILLDNGYDKDQFFDLHKFAGKSDYIVWDGMFTDKELNNKAFWGHSSIEQGIEFFQKTAIKNMLITHHDPARTDDQLKILSKDLPRGIIFAKDGMIVDFT